MGRDLAQSSLRFRGGGAGVDADLVVGVKRGLLEWLAHTSWMITGSIVTNNFKSTKFRVN